MSIFSGESVVREKERVGSLHSFLVFVPPFFPQDIGGSGSDTIAGSPPPRPPRLNEDQKDPPQHQPGGWQGEEGCAGEGATMRVTR